MRARSAGAVVVVGSSHRGGGAQGIDEKELQKLITKLVLLDREWIPRGEGYSLYIRPTAIGTQPTLGVASPGFAKLYTILSPVGPYYPEGFKPISLLCMDKYVRAWPGGTGDSKVGGNYAPTIMVQAAAAKAGHTQVLWLFGPSHNITEVGTMNLFVFWKLPSGELELVTAPLDGTILKGVTRRSILELARGWGEFKVSERNVAMEEVTAALDEGRLLEMFGAGTAAVVSPIRRVEYHGKVRAARV